MNLFESRVSDLLGISAAKHQDSVRTARINRAVQLYEWRVNDDERIIEQMKDKLRICKLIKEDTFSKFPSWPYINGIPKMLNIMCTLYNQQPTREVVVNGIVDNSATDLLNEYYSKSNINEACAEALKLSWLFRVMRIMPVIRNDKIEFDVLLPFQTELEADEDNPYKVKQLGILNERWNLETNKYEKFIIVWNEKEHYILDTNLTKIPIEKNGLTNNFINPYGIIPVGTLWLDTVDLWGDPEYKLVENFISVSLMNVWKFYNSFFHHGGIPVLTNTDLDNLTQTETSQNRFANTSNAPYPISLNTSQEKRLDVRPDTVLHLQDRTFTPSFDFKTPQSNLELIQNLIDWDIKKILSDYNIPKNAFSTESVPESGYSKMVGELEAINARKRQLIPCTMLENELFEVVKVILNYNYGVTFPEGSTLKLNYTEYEYIKSPAERAQEMDMSIKHNVKSPIDFIMEDDPELSIEDAEEIYQYNIEMNSKSNPEATELIKLETDDNHIIDFPDLRQGFDFTCGASCLQGVLFYYGEDIMESDLAKELGTTPDWGTEHFDIERVANERGYVTTAGIFSTDKLKEQIDNKTPVIIDIQAWNENPGIDYTTATEDGHYVVAIGYDEFNVLFEDPSSIGIATLSYEELEKRWHDIDKQGNEIRNWGIAIMGNPKYFRNKTIEIG